MTEKIKQVTIADGVFIYNGDCREVMAQLEPASVDAIVSDPPYGLEFMGKGWDHGVPGTPFWAEALRVLKPGGHLLAFGGTRTFHRLAVAIEDAGFEIRDTLSWMYGCLTDDAEVLTEHGWKRGADVEVGERVAQWDPDTEAITLAPVERKYLAPWDGPMRVFRNADMDQMLTPNHRVWHRTQPRRRLYPEAWQVAEASEVTTYLPTQFPLSGRHDGPGIGGEDYASLLGWVWTEGGFDNTWSGVRLYQSMTNPVKVKEIDSLIERMSIPAKRYERERTYAYVDGERAYTEVCWFFTGDWAERVRADLPGKRPTWDLLWAMTQGEKQALYDAAMAGDGSGMAFYQDSAEDREWFISLLATIGKRGRDNPRKRCVSIANRGMTEMQSRHFKAAPDEHYIGMVWCVGVPTGAFVARRNGKVFITGNSGFPKSMNVSKAIDKAAGAKREMVATHAPVEGRVVGIAGGDGRCSICDKHRGSQPGNCKCPKSSPPVTPEAERWEGWGTALKPSWEPIVMARKPFKGTVANNVLTHGTGALNIDATRIGTEKVTTHSRGSNAAFPKRPGETTVEESGRKQDQRDGLDTETERTGRWPANTLLSHDEGCEQIGTKKIKGITGGFTEGSTGTMGTKEGRYGAAKGEAKREGTKAGTVDEDGMETVEAWECVEGCPVRLLDEQSGTRKSSGVYDGDGSRRSEGAGVTSFEQADDRHRPNAMYADTGGASRFFYSSKTSKKERNAGLPEGKKNDHPTVKPITVMAWLVKMVTPPDGIVMDPFMGSGSTGIAAVQEGFRFTGVDLEPSYCNIAWHRLKHAVALKEGSNE